jgi:AcrR family transcriptional regulator
MDRRERRKQETHQRLVESAWDLFQERGYDHTTVADITEAADVAKGTFFNYFATKEAIVDHIAVWRIEVLGNHVLGGRDVPQGAVERIKLLMCAMGDEFSPEQGLVRHIVRARIGHHGRHESAHRLGSLVHELVVQGQASGEIRDDVEPGFVVPLLMTCFFYHIGRWWHSESDRPEETKLMQAVDVLMDGLQGQGRREP